MKTQFTLFILFTVILLFLVTITITFAQPLPNTPAAAPIDGGLALLAAAGGGYAIKKLRDRKE